MPSASEIAACRWMTGDDLDVYSAEYTRTGFQGALNPYRLLTGVRLSPGAFEAMQRGPLRRLLGVHLVEGAGHSIAEEQSERLNRLLIGFFKEAGV